MRSLRKGFSLIEVLAVMSVFSVALTTIVLTLCGLHRSSDRVRANLDTGVQLARFAHQLRMDAHAAKVVATTAADTAGAAPTVLQLTLPENQIIEYRLLADQIDRISRNGDTVQQRESYRLVPVVQQGWTTATTGARPLVTVCVQRPLAGVSQVQPKVPPWRVEAAVGVLFPEDVKPTAESVP